jgi:orotidine-5'-phosphate decarboxylase
MTREDAKSRIIFALDVDDFAAAERWVASLASHIGMFKVGKQLFTAYGPDVIHMIKDSGADIFLDLKYHDIPNTVAAASIEAAKLGVKLLNLHALGGYEMMARTVDRLHKEFADNDRPKILAVTILTSSTEATLRDVGIELPVSDMVVKLAKLAQRAGIDGVVASPLEVPLIREACGKDFITVTPGVRPAFASVDDQKRIMTPAEAVKAGSDYLVIGRPISTAQDPLAAADAVVAEIMSVEN